MGQTVTYPMELNGSLTIFHLTDNVSVKLDREVCNELQRYIDKHAAKEGYGVANDWHWLEQAIMLLHEHFEQDILTIKGESRLLDFFRWGKWEEICDTSKL